jgi:hypothetical protein
LGFSGWVGLVTIVTTDIDTAHLVIVLTTGIDRTPGYCGNHCMLIAYIVTTVTTENWPDTFSLLNNVVKKPHRDVKFSSHISVVARVSNTLQ